MHPHPLVMQKNAMVTMIARHSTNPIAGKIHHE
jgi:hypothetical protein